MPTNPNMVAIQTVTVGSGGASSIEFTNIPQTYTDLVIRLSARIDKSAGRDYVSLRFNSSTTNWSYRWLFGTDNGVVGTGSGANAYGEVFTTPAANATASTFGNGEIYICNYTSSNNKSFSMDSVSENNSTSVYILGMSASLWSNSAAITSIQLYPEIPTVSANFVQYSTATLYGVTSAGYGAKATGGIISQDANYFYHTFVASGTFTPTQSITADYLVVAGGGSGSGSRGSGGGAGGMRCTVGGTGGSGSLESALSLTAQSYTVTIGAGGAGTTGNGSNGSNSVFATITATGGGAGSIYDSGVAYSGGSGGGGCGNDDSSAGRGGANPPGGAASPSGQGFAGGNGAGGNGGPLYGNGGGGGGASAAGTNATTGGTMGTGGNGRSTSISGTSVTYAGGGGGSGDYRTSGYTSPIAGGSGGGGAGNLNGNGTAGTVNLGGGGGGGGFLNSPLTFYSGGAGGSGIVIVRYAK